MLKRAISLAVAFAMGGAGVASAQAMQHPAGHKRTISGTVVDMSCKFGLGLSGDDHRMCAQVCAGKGIPLVILGTDGKLYLPTSQAMPGDAQNARLTDFAEQQVTVSGTVFEAAGANAIWIDTIVKKS